MTQHQLYERAAAEIGYTIPAGVRFHETGLDLPDGLPFEDWVKVMTFLRIIGCLRHKKPDTKKLNRLRRELLA